MSRKPGLEQGLTNYGDFEFAAYLRRSFAKSMGYSSGMLGRPIIGIATAASGFNNCHRLTPELVEAVKRGVLATGGLPLEFPTISLGEVFLNPTSLVFRNLMAMDVEEMIRDAVGGIDRPANVEVSYEFSGDIRHAVGDVSQIRIVLDNLVRNAFEAMPDGGRLVISAVSQPPHLDIVVADTGHGIEPDKLKRVMEPFYSTKARGIGLGLAMAKAIVEKNNGRITATSELGKGATFTIRLKAHMAS